MDQTKMKRLYQYFFRGLITVLPIGLTVYFLYVFWTLSEQLFKSWITPVVGDAYIPGMGLTIGIGSIVILGYLISHRFIIKLLLMVEFPFANIPVVKSIYLSLKNFADYFNPVQEAPSQQAVILKSPNSDLEMIGLITMQDGDAFPVGFSPKERVAVFLPMGYNIGGYTVFVPKEWVTPVDMSAEEVMRNSLFAWMMNSKEQNT
jgi:uncharacterized membrane protein